MRFGRCGRVLAEAEILREDVEARMSMLMVVEGVDVDGDGDGSC